MAPTHNPSVFESPDLRAAQQIILTPEGDRSTDERWARETPYLTELLGAALALTPESLVIDYGCGVGRLSKALIERFGCMVLGVDSSEAMRGFAPGYVKDAAFSVVSRRGLQAMAAAGLRADAAISVWVLQHCLKPQADIGLLRKALKPGAPLGLVNMWKRAVPTVERAWVNDHLDVRALVAETFPERFVQTLAPEIVGETVAADAFWGVFG
ncbi:MAG: methyltransferase domain-containing protein [Proteobacteria bacterium]|nr:methyltransferase domain-containing protein [Pseudomonadota bacterium]